MKIKELNLTDTKGTIQFNDENVHFVNSLRRIMLSELPKLAIDNVIIYDNTSPLFDEIISHRLGHIPIPTDLQLLTFRDQCQCKGKGCVNCTVRYTLSKEGEGTIYSGDLQPEHESWKIKEDKIPIVKLLKDQRVILEVEAILGLGKNHAKWQPIQAPKITFEKTLTYEKKRVNELKEFLKELPEEIVELKNDKLVLKDPSKLQILESYLDKEKTDIIQIERNEKKITFSYETDTSLTAKDALVETTNILIKKYETFNNLLKNIK